MKRVLIITYYWPPSGGAGVQRWLKFAKYLPEFGWEPIILTVDPKHASYAQYDESLQQEVDPDLKVYRTKSYEFYSIYKKISGSKEIPYGGFANEKELSLKGKISRFARGNFFIPDPRKGWNREAYKKAKEIILSLNIETVVTTSPPHSTQLIGLKLKKKLNIKWIADFRDPWTNIYYYSSLYHTIIAKNIDFKLEQKVLNNADQIITVSKDIARSLSKRIVRSKIDKIQVIPNGYDTADFIGITSRKEEKFTITYTGTMSEVYDLSGFIDALSMLSTAQKKNIKLRFVGKPFTPTVINIKEKIPEIEIDLPGYVKHAESIRYLMQSDLQLLVIPNVKDNKGIVTGKFYEYLASQKPILAIGPKNGDLSELIEETESGLLAEYNDSENIMGWINELLLKPKGKQYGPNVNKFSRKMLTEKLSETINAY